MPTYKLDPRTAEQIAHYHKAIRKNVPWAQTLALMVLMPIITLLSRFSTKGRKNIPDGGYIVVANHRSNIDHAFVAMAVRRRIRFMGKSDIFNDRWGWLWNRLGTFPVRRGVWDTDAFESASTIVTNGRVMCMYPEGGVTDGHVVAKSGVGHIAHIAGATVLPIYITGARGMYKPWKLPRVTVTVGEPFDIQQIDEPTREQSQAAAQVILDAVYALETSPEGPASKAVKVERPGTSVEEAPVIVKAKNVDTRKTRGGW